MHALFEMRNNSLKNKSLIEESNTPQTGGRRGCDRMVVGLTTTYAISA
jgi:hypothetical protein